MAKNELIPGEPRLGWLIDENPDTDDVAVMLRDTGKMIDLTVPLKNMFDHDSYSRWWLSGAHVGNDPEPTTYADRPPRTLLVSDVRGSVVLVGCRPAGWTSSSRVGQGRVIANFAVLGGRHLRYDKIGGLRTEIPALAAWTRLSSMTVDVETDSTDRIESVQMKLTSAEPITLARPMNLVMRSTWRTERPAGGFLAYEGVELETSVRRSRDWDKHLRAHGAVLELVSIAAWKSFGISSVHVQRTDDPERSLAGSSLGERWLPVVTHRLPKHEPWTRDPRFLFPYNEIGPRGVTRWFRLRKTYDRMVSSLLNVLHSDDRWGASSTVQSGIALEALGYLIDVDKNNGVHLNGRRQMAFKQGLNVILDDMKVKPFKDVDGWIDRAHAVYMGAKHIDRLEQDSLVRINALRENILMMRFWIGLQLGVKPRSLLAALDLDPLASEFIPVD